MSSSDFANVYASINNLQNQFDAITGNTLSNYNQLSRIVAQQGNIYNSVYYGSGNIVTGNLVINNNSNIIGNVRVLGTTSLLSTLLNASNMDLSTLSFSSLSHNGYIRFGNIMAQWGNIPDVTTQTTNFSPAFSAQPYSGFIQRQHITSGGSSDSGATRILSLTTSSMTIDSVTGSSDKSAVYWLVIGPYTG